MKKIIPEHVLLTTEKFLTEECESSVARGIYEALTVIHDGYGQGGAEATLPLLYIPQILAQSEKSLKRNYGLDDPQIEHIKQALKELGDYSLGILGPIRGNGKAVSYAWNHSARTDATKSKVRSNIKKIFEFGLSLQFGLNAKKTKLGKKITFEVKADECFSKAVADLAERVPAKRSKSRRDVAKTMANNQALIQAFNVSGDYLRNPAQAVKKAAKQVAGQLSIKAF